MANFLGLLAFSALIAAQFLSMAVAYHYDHREATKAASPRLDTMAGFGAAPERA